MSEWHIEFWMPSPVNKWAALTGFSYMRKSFAEGAWAMLRAHYNQRTKHRLLKNSDVMDECGLQTLRLNVGLRAEGREK